MRSITRPSSVIAALALAASGMIATDATAPTEAQAASKVTASAGDRQAAADLAESRVGKTPYVYGGTSLWKGVDCSGLIQEVYRKQGVNLPRTSGQQKSSVRKIHRTWLREGDLVFYGNYHVGIYVGDGYIVDAPSSGRDVSKRKMWSGDRSYGTLRPA
ncbi:MAG: C40 family peptidase [Janibacter sp.]